MSDLGYLALGLGLLAVYLAAMAAVLFGAAGTLAVAMFWAYLALFAILCVGASAAVYLHTALAAYIPDAGLHNIRQSTQIPSLP